MSRRRRWTPPVFASASVGFAQSVHLLRVVQGVTTRQRGSCVVLVRAEAPRKEKPEGHGRAAKACSRQMPPHHRPVCLPATAAGEPWMDGRAVGGCRSEGSEGSEGSEVGN